MTSFSNSSPMCLSRFSSQWWIMDFLNVCRCQHDAKLYMLWAICSGVECYNLFQVSRVGTLLNAQFNKVYQGRITIQKTGNSLLHTLYAFKHINNPAVETIWKYNTTQYDTKYEISARNRGVPRTLWFEGGVFFNNFSTKLMTYGSFFAESESHDTQIQYSNKRQDSAVSLRWYFEFISKSFSFGLTMTLKYSGNIIIINVYFFTRILS